MSRDNDIKSSSEENAHTADDASAEGVSCVFPIDDPEDLLSFPSIESTIETNTIEEDEYESTRDRYDAVAGVAIIGVLNDEGEVLLMKGPHGWSLPASPVMPDDGWAESVRDLMKKQASIDVEVTSVELVRAINFQKASGGTTDSHIRTYEIVLGGGVGGGTIQTHDDEEGMDTQWFDQIPEDADWSSDGVINDIRRIMER